MALYLEFQTGILFHQFRNAEDFHHGFRFQVGLAGFKGDGVGNDLPIGHQPVIERNGAFGDADIADAAEPIGTATEEEEIAGRLHRGHVDDADTVDIPLECAFVKGEGKMVPLSGLDRAVRGIIGIVVAQAERFAALDLIVAVRLCQRPADAGGTVFPILEGHLTAGIVIIALPRSAEAESQRKRGGILVGERGNKQIVFNGEVLRQPGPFLFHVGQNLSDSVVGKRKNLPTGHGSGLYITVQQFPAQRKLAQLLIGEVVVKKDLISRDKICLGIRGGNRRRHRCRLRNGRLFFRGRGGFRGLLLFLSFIILLLVFLLAVQDIIHTLFHFVADVFFYGIFGALAQPSQKALGSCSAAHEQQCGDEQNSLFHD